ncbi:N(G),N(G)-dimethylarginine dimethylaminohydrolase 1 [Chionoecetes opilio]|uniref:N(G),N(G)-dimethylarginine dimethylaminohydrolase 1 n=1 Tax=Chionoecetes opilio TaxID=41210 RepID=A0A8J4YDN9_CHIOP|nr:N(G),N(G)-dimethylarginine dimethylaminohydrolase 1 [Chionoecetes opilio]
MQRRAREAQAIGMVAARGRSRRKILWWLGPLGDYCRVLPGVFISALLPTSLLMATQQQTNPKGAAPAPPSQVCTAPPATCNASCKAGRPGGEGEAAVEPAQHASTQGPVDMSNFRYTHAIVCRLPDSYKSSALGLSGPVDLPKARKQHEMYVASLREIGLDVIELPADEKHPDCVFVEDVAIVCNGTALLTKPGHPDRKNEVVYMREILKNELELPVIEITDKNATLDGGDVLFTGKEFFVGLSSRTNQAGACALASAFPEFHCTPIKASLSVMLLYTVENSLHLKTAMTMCGPDVICVGSTPSVQNILKRIVKEAMFKYQTVTVPDWVAANVVFANGFLLHRSAEDYPETAKVFEEKLSHWTLKSQDFSEFEKANGSLTCCSILIRKTRHLKNIM